MVFNWPYSPSSTDSDTESVAKRRSCPFIPRTMLSAPFSQARTDSDTRSGGMGEKAEKRKWKLGLNSDQLGRKAMTGPAASRKALAKNPKAKRDALVGSKNKKEVASGSGMDKAPAVATAVEVIMPNLKMYKLAELKSATRNFRPDSVLGEGGFGRVFKGFVDERTLAPSEHYGSGIPVAVKKSKPDSHQGVREWQSEIEILGKLSHPNVVKLMGYCQEDDYYLLVYEFVMKTSLENNLFKWTGVTLPWDVRLKIAIGAARGLEFLHTPENNIIFRDFKSSNILLDADYNAKLSDFGLAKQGPAGGDSYVSTRVIEMDGYAAPEYSATSKTEIPSSFAGNAGSVTTTLFRRLRDYLAGVLRNDFGQAKLGLAGRNSHVTTQVIGTHGYAAPEYIATGHLYVKSDVYAFGVVLLELLTGLRVLDKNRPSFQQNLVEWVRPLLHDKRKMNLRKIMDRRLEGRYPPKAASQAAELILKCLEADPKARPSMKKVLATLENINTIQEKN